jgi:hypothetical protein
MIVRVDNNNKAQEVLNNEGFTLVEAAELWFPFLIIFFNFFLSNEKLSVSFYMFSNYYNAVFKEIL